MKNKPNFMKSTVKSRQNKSGKKAIKKTPPKVIKNPQSEDGTPDKHPENLLITDICFKNNYIASSRKKSITQEDELRETVSRKVRPAFIERADSPEVVQTFAHLAQINNEQI
jgi:hypothetical protein